MQGPGLTQKAPAAFLQVEALAAVIGFMDQLLLNQAPREPSPIRSAALLGIEPLTEIAGIRAMKLRQQLKNRPGLIGPVLPGCTGQTAVTATTGGNQLTNGEQQSLLPAGLSLSDGLHPPQLLLRQFNPPGFFDGIMARGAAQSALHGPPQAGAILG